MSDLLAERRRQDHAAELMRPVFRAVDELHAAVEVLQAALPDLLHAITDAPQTERWWISDGGPLDRGGKKVLGPFGSRDLALEVRRLLEERPDACLTYWVSTEVVTR
jgi:hypothetical protein